MEKKDTHLFYGSQPLIHLWLIFASVLAFLTSNGQEFGGNPPSLTWRQVNSDTARVIFPAGLEKQAQEVSAIVHQLAAQSRPSLGSRIRKIDIVLQNQTTQSNGYVALGPFRSELYLTPRQNSFELGSLPWHKTLSLHEYRHVQQFNNFRKGLSKAFYYVFGEEGQALANSLAVPDWFFEGDAVYQETVMSTQGRGRIPYFFNGYRSLLAADKKYSWMKLRNGSLRDYVPDHYQLGYMLVNYGYHKFGEHAWKKITGDAVRFKHPIYPLQQSFKRNTGQRFRSFTEEAIHKFDPDSLNKYATDKPSAFAADQKHFAGDELYPQWIDSTHLLLLKNSYSRIPAFYIRNIPTGKDKKIANRSVSTDLYFSYRNGKIVYAAYEPDARWSWKNYENLKLIDVATGKERAVTRKTKLFSPDISADGKTIVAVYYGPSGTSELQLIGSETGKLLSAIPNPEGYVFTYPKFFDNSHIVSAIRDSNGQMALTLFSTDGKTVQHLVPFSYRIIGFPQMNKDTVLFTMSNGDKEELYGFANGQLLSFVPSDENRFTGNYQLAAANGRYTWTAFTAAGFHLLHGSGTFKPTTPANLSTATILEPVAGMNLIHDTVPATRKVDNYRKEFKLFNFHSWRPYISDPDYSYSLVSENILNTLQSEIYFNYNRNENFKESGAALSYGAWFPVINAGGSFTLDRSYTDTAQRIDWNEMNARLGLNVPLSFVNGAFTQNMNIAGTFNTKQVYYTRASKEAFDNKRFNYLDFIVSATNQQVKARQNIFPRFAQTLFARYRTIINKFEGHQLLLNANIYLPGIWQNHNLVLQASYQRRDTLLQYSFSNSFPFSRGYTELDFPRMWRLGANYHFPILYPDVGFANIVYMLRIRGNAFYDFSKVKSLRTGRLQPFNTVGGEVYFDTKWWNQLPISFGIRYSRLLDADLFGISANQWEFVLPTNLLGR